MNYFIYNTLAKYDFVLFYASFYWFYHTILLFFKLLMRIEHLLLIFKKKNYICKRLEEDEVPCSPTLVKSTNRDVIELCCSGYKSSLD